MPPVLTALAVLASITTAPPPPLLLIVDPARAAGADPRVVRTLADAVQLVGDAPPGTPSFDIRIAPGLHEVSSSIGIGKLPAPLRIHGAGPASRLIGGAAVHRPLLRLDPANPILTRLPPESGSRVRSIDLRSPWEAGGAWVGRAGIGGPMRHGMNLPAAAGSELFLDGTPLIPARWPNAGFAIVESVVDPGSSKDRTKPGQPLRPGVFRFADLAHLARWGAADGVWLSGYWHWDWADDDMPAGKIDPEEGTIALGLPHTYGLGKGARFRVTNIPEELDAPGEYWIDARDTLAYLIPPAGCPETPELIVSLLAEPIIALDGASDVLIADLQLEAGRGLAISATNVDALRVERCAFRNTGTGAVELTGRASAVRDCTFENIGATGVLVAGGDRATLTHAGNEVRGCAFRACARTHRTYQPAVRIEGVGQTVAGNRMEDLPHCAVIFAGNEHVIELNDVSRVLLETGDSGAIYCGRDWTLHGTVVRHNLFHDIQGTDARYQNAVYLDDMASGIAVEGNVFVRCHWGMLVGGGRDIRIAGNVFDSCAKGLSFDARGAGWMAKDIADPARSTIRRRLLAVPIDREPWSTRYPTLATYLTDRFGRPANGLVEGNVFLATPLGRIDDRECVRLEANVESPTPLDPALVARLLDPARRAGLGDLVPGNAPPGFNPIPVSRIGPRMPSADER